MLGRGTNSVLAGFHPMQVWKHVERPGDIVLEVDGQTRAAVSPHRDAKPVKTLSWFSEIGDQPQMRLVAVGMLCAGLLRRDVRMARAGTRMLLAHELATAAKNFVKKRVDRARPRSAKQKNQQKARPGRSTAKEMTSFPSGHSAGAASVARAFAREYPERGGPALAAASLVALAQIPRCAHYPTDVGAGIAIGAAAEKLVDFAWRILVPVCRTLVATRLRSSLSVRSTALHRGA